MYTLKNYKELLNLCLRVNYNSLDSSPNPPVPSSSVNDLITKAKKDLKKNDV
jgi:hypothetical protein